MTSLFRSMMMVASMLVMVGCAADGYQKFYEQKAPTAYEATDEVRVFSYANMRVDDIYDVLFSDFLIIGRSGFVGPYQDPTSSETFACSIGADVFLSTAQFEESVTELVPMTLPDTQVSNFSGYSDQGSFYGTATTYGTRTLNIPVTVDRYTQDGLFLKNVGGGSPLWRRTKGQYRRTSSSQFEGVWFNANYTLEVYQSGDQVVGFIVGRTKGDGREHWESGDLKMLFGPGKGKGVYLMGDRCPVPATFEVNRFGHLEVKLFSEKDGFSFKRQE